MHKRGIKKILVANRGEIALRVMKTCRQAGIKTVAVYSSIDKNSSHVKFADEAFLLGNAPAAESYLNAHKIVEIAKASHVDAIHPGYGFLSENPGFVELVQANGMVFIGPSASAIRKMGDKTAARKLAKSIGVPVVPGSVEPVSSYEEAVSVASEIKFPVMLKAAGGGGGKGMRIVNAVGELASALKSAQSEAKSAFGDDRIYIEKYIDKPRHIEVQILSDVHGGIIHLGERECSIQRRHQKIIEESPSVIINDELRQKITRSAIDLVKESGYTNAGTIEFLFDREKNFYFLEMNTRLQVEHPVTEMRVGVDIVREQIRIGEGRPLSLKQDDIRFNGHSIECRIYAEDPENNFFPSVGKILSLKSPSGFGIREDRGIEENDDITTYYDPLVAKLIVWGKDRSEAIERMASALDSYEIFGIRNNLRLCKWIMGNPVFKKGDIDTNFLSSHFNLSLLPAVPEDILEAGAIAAVLKSQMLPILQSSFSGRPRSTWKCKMTDSHR